MYAIRSYYVLHFHSILIILGRSVDTNSMDVITVLRPENNFTVNAFTVPRAGVAATRSEGGRYQFALPTAHAILLGLAVALALVPPLQRSIGLYRLEKISLSPDGSLPVAFDSVLGPSPAGTELEASAAVLEAASAAIAETVPEALKPSYNFV